MSENSIDFIKSQIEKTDLLNFCKTLVVKNDYWNIKLEDPKHENHFFNVIVEKSGIRNPKTTIMIFHDETGWGTVDSVFITLTEKEPFVQMDYNSDWRDEIGSLEDPFAYLGFEKEIALIMSLPTFFAMDSEKMDWKWIENELKLAAIKEI